MFVVSGYRADYLLIPSFHRNEILAGAIFEYTDPTQPAQHPLNVRDETIDALGDAQVSFLCLLPRDIKRV